MKRIQADHLTDEEVAELNRMIVAGFGPKHIAAQFNISVRIAQSRIASFQGRGPAKRRRPAFMPMGPKPETAKSHPAPFAIPSVLSKIRGGRA